MSTKFLFGSVVCLGMIAPLCVRADEQKPGEAQAPAATAPEQKPAKADETKVHGRLPQFYSKVGVTSDQKLKIYSIQSSYAPKIDAVEKQLHEVESQRNAEIRAVLTADQQKKLDELISEHKGKRTPEDTKPADTKSNTPATTNSTKVTESTAK